MVQSTSEEVCYRFDVHRLCARTRRLITNNEIVPIENKVFDLIVYLIKHRDRTVSKEELEKTIWAGRPLSETVLSRCVMKARKALGDDATTPRYIATVRGFGYRFTVDSVEVEEPPSDLTESSVKASFLSIITRKRTLRKNPVLVVTLMVIMLTYLGLFYLGISVRQVDATRGVYTLSISPIRNNTGNSELDPLLSRMTSVLDRRFSNISWLSIKDVYTVGDVDSNEDYAPERHFMLACFLNMKKSQYQIRFVLTRRSKQVMEGYVTSKDPFHLARKLVKSVKSAMEKSTRNTPVSFL